MSWPFSRRPKKGLNMAPNGLETGVHSSPGMAMLCGELGKVKPDAILDLGATSTENLRFLSGLCEEVTVEDLIHGVGGPQVRETESRKALFEIPDVDALELPSGAERFDVVLFWDLLHYTQISQIPRLLTRILDLCNPGALLWIIASARTPIPLAPLRFRIESEGQIFYQVAAGRAPAPGLMPRQLEKWMVGCAPLRHFQLRNGFQELLFRLRETPVPPIPVVAAKESAGAKSKKSIAERHLLT